ncbi:hemerythrin domain-containing protein [uncultured Piscinibacter sp.]|uniref:hemerythrin domain-containing protein n=1 Tax=uncultured Piscinibacter sp. TaxID=1131835 RepID=UPI00260A3807|nr:hemerythrin domain-containing protein [uncultured Piscinibacter sp.]
MKNLLHPSPGVGFEQPFEMLVACHDRVRRSLALLGRLLDHVERHGHDAKSRSAARDVLRYFELAAPHHHEDEERHVFPRLLAGGDAALVQAVRRLRADHERLAALWARLRPVLQAWAGDTAAGAAGAAFRDDARAFQALYDEHIPLEERLVFPAARSMCDETALAAMGGEMQSRRRDGTTMPQ